MKAAELFDFQGHRKYLNKDERRRFHRTIIFIPDLAFRTFCFMLYHTGCRVSEALSLTPQHIDFSEKVIVVKTLKKRGGVHYRLIPMHWELRRALKSLIKQLQIEPDQPIWQFSRITGWRRVKACMERIGLTGIKATPKGLRHSFAIASMMRGVPLTKLKKWMGHESLETTEIYVNFVGKDDRMFARRLWKTDLKTKIFIVFGPVVRHIKKH